MRDIEVPFELAVADFQIDGKRNEKSVDHRVDERRAFFTVGASLPVVALNAFAGMVLNQSGRPRTAAMGRGRIASSADGQRNVRVISPAWSTLGKR